MQRNIAVDVLIENINQRFTDLIADDNCSTFCQCFERTFARLPPTLGDVYFEAMIASDRTPVRCEKQSPENTLSVALVICFRIRSYYVARRLRDV